MQHFFSGNFYVNVFLEFRTILGCYYSATFLRFFFSKSRRIPCILYIPLWLSICSLNRYEDLENEAKELGVASEAEVIILLNKLYPFAVDDITTLPFVQVCS